MTVEMCRVSRCFCWSSEILRSLSFLTALASVCWAWSAKDFRQFELRALSPVCARYSSSSPARRKKSTNSSQSMDSLSLELTSSQIFLMRRTSSRLASVEASAPPGTPGSPTSRPLTTHRTAWRSLRCRRATMSSRCVTLPQRRASISLNHFRSVSMLKRYCDEGCGGCCSSAAGSGSATRRLSAASCLPPRRVLNFMCCGPTGSSTVKRAVLLLASRPRYFLMWFTRSRWSASSMHWTLIIAGSGRPAAQTCRHDSYMDG
mmetsp:Transcript_109281/g.309142  ORF Transcript_109281/g.309142 Transcript_109281/m.309142 type:complete len:261 (-) Transcript_109281:222-1004(-)